MKKLVVATVAALAILSLLSCASSGGRAEGVSLREAIALSAGDIAGGLPAGTLLAVVAFESESDGLSDFIMEELATAMLRLGVQVADRRNLDLAFRELDFQMSGLVSDETALSIGRMLGAQLVVTGQFLNLGGSYRFSANAMQVETAIRQSAASYDVPNDRALEQMIEALSRRTTRRTAEYEER